MRRDRVIVEHRSRRATPVPVQGELPLEVKTDRVMRRDPEAVEDEKGRLAVHTCHVPHCNERCARTMLMCGRHWSKVPRELARAVWAAFRKGQCDPGSGVRPSKEWFRAAHAAIDHVVTLEKGNGPG